MKDKNKVIKLIHCISIILLYYIYGKNSMFLYVITLCLYNIFLSCFSHITLKDVFKKVNYNYSKFKILKYVMLIIVTICLLFTITSILLSDTINVFLNVENPFWPYLIMSLSVFTEPLIKLFLEYLQSYNRPKLANSLLNVYYILETIFLLIIGMLTILVFKYPIHISIALLYTSKLISFVFVSLITIIILNKQNINMDKEIDEVNVNYKKEIKDVLKNNNHKSIIKLVKNGYYYISVIILYMVLSTRYSYNINEVEQTITFIYLYGLAVISFIIDVILPFVTNQEKKTNVISDILMLFKFMITLVIIMAVTSPLICNIIFFDNSNSMYFMMLSFLSIFISLFDITFDNIKNKRVIYISLIVGILTKAILIVPLINSFYRMGYNLVYGDIISTIISMFISIMVNYIYLKSRNKKEKTLDRILTTLYDSIILCIILVILQFIIPIKTDNYIKSIFIFGIYIFISIAFLMFKKKKRG